MATTVIRNNILGGAIAGMMADRDVNSIAPADYASAANVADAFASACITANAALSVPMADADNANIGAVCFGAAFATCYEVFNNSTSATDPGHVANAKQCVAMAKQAAGKLL